MPTRSIGRKNLIVIALASVAWAFSFGLGTQVATHWLRHAQASDTIIGLNHACYYLGIALASFAIPRLHRVYGNRCAPLGMILSGVSLALFPWGGGPAGWFSLRLLSGAAGAACLIPLETIVSRDSSPETRGRNFGIYAVALTIGGALGIGAGLHFFEPGNPLPFLLGGLMPLGGGLLLWLGLRRKLRAEKATGRPTPIGWATNYLSYGTAWSQGFLEGGMLAFLSLYLLAIGLSPDAAGGLMAVTMIGVILFQIPVSWLADRYGRLAVLLGCYAVVLLTLLVIPVCDEVVVLALLLLVFGACSGAMYPLGMALLGDQETEQAVSRAYACYMAMECVGSQMGAAAMGRARDAWGETSMFTVGFVALIAVLISWVLVRGMCRPAATGSSSPIVEPKEAA